MKTFAISVAALLAATGASLAGANTVDRPAVWQDSAYGTDYSATASIAPVVRDDVTVATDYSPLASKGERYGDAFAR
jgi:hypothetical protein